MSSLFDNSKLDIETEKMLASLIGRYADDPIEALYRYACHLRDERNFPDAVKCFALHEEICEKKGRHRELAISLNEQALTYINWGQPNKGIDALHRGEAVARQWKLKHELQMILGNQANILRQRQRIDQAMTLHKEEERICREIGDTESLQRCLGNQALILRDLGRPREALLILEEQERICREGNYEFGLQLCLGEMGVLYQNEGKYEKALDLLREQEAISRRIHEYEALQRALLNQATILIELEQLDRAIPLLNEQIQTCRNLGDRFFLQIGLGKLSDVFRRQENFDQALELSIERLNINRDRDDAWQLIQSLCDVAVTHILRIEAAKALPFAQEAYSLAIQNDFHDFAEQRIQLILDHINRFAH